MAEVVLQNVIKRYGDVVAVDNVSLTIRDGEFVSLVGPSGCGKTTTLNMIAGLIELTDGDIFIGDRLVTDLDPKDRDTIIAHTEEVKQQMDDTQTTNESVWFDNTEEKDVDFPSGISVSTNTHNNKCVFLRRDGRCSVQLVSAEKYNDPWKIKPFYCVAFPIVLENGLITYDDYQDGNTKCCSIVHTNEETLIDSCKAELVYVLGEEGYQKLKDHQKTLPSSDI